MSQQYERLPEFMAYPDREKAVFLSNCGRIIKEEIAGRKHAYPFRWTVLRKARLLSLISSGFIKIDEAADALNIPERELERWKSLYKRYGLPGLKATRRK
jgi:hypothetical protein